MLIDDAHKAGAKVVLSIHNMQSTPSNAQMIRWVERHIALGAEILKLAVMSHDSGDVIRLLQVTGRMRQVSNRPLLIMAMGDIGAVSRIAGEAFGSNLAFGSQGNESASGQINVDVLHQVLKALHQSDNQS